MTPREPRIRPKSRVKRSDLVALLDSQIAQWEQTQAMHELNLMNLSSLPEDLRGPDHDASVSENERAVATIQNSIDNATAERDAHQRKIAGKGE